MLAVAVVRAGETVRYPTLAVQASLAHETLALALFSFETEEKSMQGNLLKTSSHRKVTYSSCYSVLCFCFIDQNLLRWRGDFSISGFSHSRNKLCMSPAPCSIVLLDQEDRCLHFQMDIFTVPWTNSNVIYAHTYA